MKNKLNIIALCTMPILASASPYDGLILKHAQLQGLDPHLVKSIMSKESNFNPKARSHKNAKGLMQVIPSTAKFVGVNPNRLYEPEQSIIAGTRYLAFLKKRYDGNMEKMIAGYNAGHGAVDKYDGIPPFKETKKYVRLVSDKYQDLSGDNIQHKTDYNDILREPSISVSITQRQKSDILVLTSWQQQQSQNYGQLEKSQDYQNTYVESVQLRASSKNNTINTPSVSFVQTLDQGEYISVF